MIPNKTEIMVSGNMTGQSVRMGFAEGAEIHLMSLLTNMYSDTELAVVREYSTNALDSHRAAGNPRPIEVTLPSPLSPFLKIKDYGLGLSVDDIHNIYSRYGASTKRGDQDANGMLGIGCKSALTYSSQFTLVGVKAGIRTTVAVSRNEDRSNAMTIVDTSATTQPNGVEVSIPAKAGNSIEHKARTFFANWQPGTVLVNGAEPVHTSGMGITDSIMLVRYAQYSQSSHIVMAGVTYPAGEKLNHYSLGVPQGYSLLAVVPTGAVDFAPSREALIFSKITNEVIDQIARDFKANLVPAVQRELDAQNTRAEAVWFVNKWAKVLGSRKPASFRWKGADMPTQIARPFDRKADGSSYRMLLTSAGDYKLSAASNVPVVDLSYLDKTVWVTGYDLATFTATHKKKLRMWLEGQRKPAAGVTVDFNVSNFILVDFPLDTTWIEPSRVIKWEDVNELKLPKTERLASGRLPGSYDLIVKKSWEPDTKHRRGVAGSDIDQTNPVFYFEGNLDDIGYDRIVLRNTIDAFTIVLLPANRVAKFTRENPQIKSVQDHIQVLYKAWSSGLTDEQRLALHICDEGCMYPFQMLAKYDSYIDDPDVVTACKVSSVDTKKLLEDRRKLGRRINHQISLGVTWTDPMVKYPLFPSSFSVFSEHAEHVIAYMNATYALLLDEAA